MPGKRIFITKEDFEKTKLEHKHNWSFLGEIKYGNPKYVFCKCDLCKEDSWVIWRWVQLGKTKRCKKCHKKPDFQSFNKILLSKGIRWQINPLSKTTNPKGTNIKRRSYWCTCLDCGKSKWVQWSTLQSFKSKRCVACSSRLIQRKMSRNLTPVEEHLWYRWKRFFWYYSDIPVNWKSFEEFKSWAFAEGFAPGKRLCRKRKGKNPYSSENCYWANTVYEAKHKARFGSKNTIRVSDIY